MQRRLLALMKENMVAKLIHEHISTYRVAKNQIVWPSQN